MRSHSATLNMKEMLYYAGLFFVVALIAGVLGFTGIMGAATSIAQVCFVLFLVLFVLSLFRNGSQRRGAGL